MAKPEPKKTDARSFLDQASKEDKKDSNVPENKGPETSKDSKAVEEVEVKPEVLPKFRKFESLMKTKGKK